MRNLKRVLWLMLFASFYMWTVDQATVFLTIVLAVVLYMLYEVYDHLHR